MEKVSSSGSPVSSKAVWLWSLYDLANSLAFANVSFYFSLWLVRDKHISDIWVSLPAAISTIALILTVPYLGFLSDRLGRRMPFLVGSSLLAIGSLLTFGVLSTQTSTRLIITLIVIFYCFFQYFYQAALTFYDALIQSLVGQKSKEQISGLGMAAGQLGNALGLILALPFVSGNITLIGVSGRPSAFILGGLLFLLFSAPTFYFLKDKPIKKDVLPETQLSFLNGTRLSLKDIYQNRPAFNYLIVYYLFSDALLTLQLFITLYLEVVGGFDDKMKTLIAVISLLVAVFGSLISSRIARLLGGTRKTISYFIALWALFLLILAMAHSTILILFTTALNGFAFGVLYSLSRAYFSDLAPKEKQAEFFSIYTLFERCASILGPVVWSTVILITARFGPIAKYRFGMLSLAVIVGLSFVLFRLTETRKIT
ncbi:MFS transporter [Candidatus Uhrbacteria bacterium]|nr:MFS transporter [Candidatus Uhrbacteria bacterium]